MALPASRTATLHRFSAGICSVALVIAGLLVASPRVSASALAAVEAPTAVMPAAPEGTVAIGVSYDGSWIYGFFRSASATSGNGVLYRAPLDGSESWLPVVDPDTGEPITGRTGLAVRGGAVLTRAANDPATYCPDYLLVVAGTSRHFESCDSPILGHGGVLLARRDSTGGWRVERVSDAAEVGTPGSRPVLDGALVWTVSGATLHGLDTGAATTVSVAVPPECAGGPIVDAVGRWAVIACAGAYDGTGQVLIDLEGGMTAWAMPSGSWRLGTDYAVRTPPPSAPAEAAAVEVLDFSSDHEVHSYGPARYPVTDSDPPGPDDGGSASVAYITDDGQIARADLAWLGQPPVVTDDPDAPVIDRIALPAVVKAEHYNTAVDLSWSGHDPGHADSLVYDLRVHDGRSPGPYWEYPAALQATFATSYTYVEPSPDTRVCFEIRARDWVGNVSAWTVPRCTLFDGLPPWVTMSRSYELVRDQLARTPVSVPFIGFDDDRVASYDVQFRTALPGQDWGAWASPAGWQDIATTSVQQRVRAGSRTCFRARARDRAGLLGSFSNPWCVNMPYDDSDFTVRGDARRVRLKAALGHTATVLRSMHGALSRRGVSGRSVWIRIVGATSATGCAVVTLGSKTRGRRWCTGWNGEGSTWQGFRFPASSHGTLRIRIPADRGPLRVDAIAVLS